MEGLTPQATQWGLLPLSFTLVKRPAPHSKERRRKRGGEGEAAWKLGGLMPLVMGE